MPQLFNKIVGNTPEQQAKIDEIMRRGEEERRQIARENLLDNARIAGGALLSGASALPFFNIPYIGTGIGGAMEGAGQAIMQGKSGKDIASDAGIGFAIGETVGAIPYAGKFAGKTKAGQAVAGKANDMFNKIMALDAGKKVSDFAKKAEDVLMTDIKAFNPNKQTVYHGSPYDFNKFSNEAIGTGEGAQAHGYGHYAAVDKDVASGYADRLSSNLYSNLNKIENTPLKSLTDDTKTRLQIDGRDITEARLKNDLSYYKNKLQDMEIKGTYIPEVNQKYIQKIQEFQNDLNLLNNFDESILTSDKQLYKLSIPKDDVMLREGATFAEQPKAVQNTLRNIVKNENSTEITNLKNAIPQLKKEYDEVKNAKESYMLGYASEIKRSIETAKSRINYLQNDKDIDEKATNILADFIKNKNNPDKVRLLNENGIKGISYYGGIDGEARVIFNPNDIEIVRKYYNQPSLYEKIINALPNAGAVSSYILNN